MKILVINAGSSSLKYQLIDMDTEQMIAKGNCERIGQDGSFIGHKTADGRSFTKEIPMPDHALMSIMRSMLFAVTVLTAPLTASSPAQWRI